MKKFNLEDAKLGADVVTDNNQDVRIVDYKYKLSGSRNPLILAIVSCVNSHNEFHGIFNEDGLSLAGEVQLYMKSKAHKHAELIMIYAQLAAVCDEPGVYFDYDYGEGWKRCANLSFNENCKYRVKPDYKKLIQ